MDGFASSKSSRLDRRQRVMRKEDFLVADRMADHSCDVDGPLALRPVIPGVVRGFLRGDYKRIDPRLPEWLDILSGVGAGECWHKKSRRVKTG